jgi:hypothetical protein
MYVFTKPVNPNFFAAHRWYHNKGIVLLRDDHHSLHFGAFARQNTFWIEVILPYGKWEWFEMAARTKFGTTFVNVRVSREERNKIDAWAIDHETEQGDMLDALVCNGYKVSLNQDVDNDCILVAVTGGNGSPYNRGLCMTSRAGSPLEALYLAFYKHFVMCDGKEWPEPDDIDRSYG